ncbi:MAG: T9SS type A sorting domain-containing protein [Saprospiraceae bacterium]|nr:T9SS type A sorting domain-containing protein [Saprospiraceae bacterium]
MPLRMYELRIAKYEFRTMVVGLLFLMLPVVVESQVTCLPVFPKTDDDVTITFDATQGNGALAGVSPVYAHAGVITNQSNSPSDWKYVKTTWGVADPNGAMTSAGANLWTKSFNIRSFFGIPQGETVLKLAFVFRSTDGSVVGRATGGFDIFYEVYPDNFGLHTLLLAPSSSPVLATVGGSIPVRAAASISSNLRLYDNGNQVASATGTLLETSLTASSGIHTVAFVAEAGPAKDTSQFVYIVPANLPAQNPPAGTAYGINYVDAQTVRLQLYAPNKQVVHLIGDFNDWTPNEAYQMKRNVIGNVWWFELTGLTPGQPYRFQYLVDGTLRIADPLSTLVLDPWNDGFISPLTYPDLPAYPAGKTNGVVSVFQTNQPPYNWQATNFVRPKKTDLVIYELLLRDFLDRHDYATLLDTLDYLQRLGVTAIELMPINEFDGNISWGYNPAYHKALDKYYGNAESLKRLVDECHQRGMAVIVDVVFNQASGSSPLAQLYWDAANNQTAANNPWFNPKATHDFSVFHDFNHESALTKIYVKNCLQYWLEEFKLDGFRFDLSKGFTQKNTVGSLPAWAAKDPSRIAILKDYANFMWSISPGAYVILEHFADNEEEKELAEFGAMLWGNLHFDYNKVALGSSAAIGADLRWISHQTRGWNVPHVIGYMESHDEERIAYACLQEGNTSNPNHNIRTLPVAMRRLELLTNLLYTVPGPKMLWEFGELGYDFSINYCTDGTVNNCRLDPKPIRWDYLSDPYRRRLHDVTAALLHLRANYDVFETSDFQLNLGNGQVRSIYLNSPAMNVAVLANVGVTNTSATATFQHTGTWYEYYSGSTLEVTGTSTQVLLGPGEYRLYLDQFVPLPGGLNPTPTAEANGLLKEIQVYPNPAHDWFLVDFVLEKQADVRAEVFDATGRLVAVPWSGERTAGAQQVRIDASAWAPGLYWVVLSEASGGQVLRKVVVYGG